MDTYECDRCGACCQGHLIVEAYDLDMLREPRLATADVGHLTDGITTQEVLAAMEEPGRCLILACGTDHPCKFLGQDNLCQIHPTRPNACVAMEAGDPQCQEARAEAGLPPLLPAQAV